jgi:putative transposon-encoded protein
VRFITKISILSKRLRIEEEIEAVIEGLVKPLGNGAMVIASKNYIEKKAYVIVRKNR